MSQSMFGRLFQTILNLFSRQTSPDTSGTPSSPPLGSHEPSSNTTSPEPQEKKRRLAWSTHQNVSLEFCHAVIAMCKRLGIREPDWMMACMAFETGPKTRFLPSARNLAGSTGTGLIQFMASTARDLGTTVGQLREMTQLEQLVYVEKYFQPYKGRLNSLEDLYMAILWPAAIGKPLNHPLFKHGTLAYSQNAGLDKNRDGVITKDEAAAKVQEALILGREAIFYGEV